MDITMNVHRASVHSTEVEVDYQGQKARAMMPQLEVELFHDEAHGSLTLRFRKVDEVAAAKDLFVPGEDVVVSFAKVKAEEPAAA